MDDGDVRHDLIVLTGGAARRLGGVDKAMLPMPDDRPVLAHVLDAPARLRVVVGPRRPVPHVDGWTRESPPGGGPVAALAAGLVLTSADVVVVVGGDMPFAAGAVPVLVSALGPGSDVAVVRSGDRDQYLLAAWRRRALAGALRRVGPTPSGAAMRRLFQGVEVVRVPDTAEWGRDLDTPPTSGDTPAPLTAWIADAADLLGLDAADVPVAMLLDLARDAAHGVARPAAPLTTFLAGLAAGRAGGSPADIAAAVATLTARLGAVGPAASD